MRGSFEQRTRTSFARGLLSRFAGDESGNLIIFGVYVWVLIFMVAGIGIDLMHFERDRVQLQNTLDSAVLAAADLNQPQDPTSVVEDYFEKAGFAPHLTSVSVSEGLGYRSVIAHASKTMSTQFMHMNSVDTLMVPAVSGAEERIESVEISLVLDISETMNSNNRLANLKIAASDFLVDLFEHADATKVSVSIVPYSTQVNAGQALLGKYTVTQEHNYSHCVNFTDDEFSKTNLATGVTLERTAHFDPFTESENMITAPVCPARANSAILPLTNDLNAMLAYIDGMTAKANSSIDIGMKWGTVLLDPSTRSVVNDLISDGEISAQFQNRPNNYDDDATLKVIILMSDGENSDQFMLNPSMRDGMSEVWYNAESDRYSVYKSNTALNYWWPHKDKWYDHPYGNGQHSECNESGACYNSEEAGTAVQLTYQELLARASLEWIAEELFSYSPSASAEWYTAAFSKKESAAKNQRTKNMCAAAKGQGIFIYSVSFEASKPNDKVLLNCASSPAHYFEVSGLQIVDAFTSIASGIRKLRLTQ